MLIYYVWQIFSIINTTSTTGTITTSITGTISNITIATLLYFVRSAAHIFTPTNSIENSLPMIIISFVQLKTPTFTHQR